MSDHIDNAIRVALDGTIMTATLRICAGTDAADVNQLTVSSIASARGIHASEALERGIAEAVAAYDAEAEHDFEYIIARGTPAKHGQDGRFEFDDAIIEILDRAARLKRRRPAEVTGETHADEIEGDACHYQRSTIAVVKLGDRIGCIVEPTPGEDGIDVCGGNAPARHGAPATIEVDDASITRRDDGVLIATAGGLLNTADNHLRITEDLIIGGYVDFSTGNVEFDGDITVEKGVRDCFVVDAAGSVKVLGQAEAATLRAGRDIILLRGMTGRDKGVISAGRDLRARFIDSAELNVGRDLHIDREITHCTITIGRDLIGGTAALLGGECTVAGSAELAQIGSESGSATLLRLGQLPSMETLIREAIAVIPKLEQRGTDAREQLEQLQAHTSKLTAVQAESMTELQFLAMQAQGKLTPLRESLAGAIRLVESATACSLVVNRKVLPGVDLVLGGRIAHVHDEIVGPVRIELDDQGEPVIVDVNTGNRTPLTTRARMNIDETRLDFDDVRQQLGIAA